MIWQVIRLTAVVLILGYESVSMWHELTRGDRKSNGWVPIARFAFAVLLYGAAGIFDVFTTVVR